ncbi:MAG: hypothetical protein ABL998_12155 [Planctomycetota bacterium]
MARIARAGARSFAPPFLALLALCAAPRAQGCEFAFELGMNPSFHTFGSRAVVFADAFQRARSFHYWSGGNPTGDAPLIPLGQGRIGEGWPDPAQLAAGQRYGAYLFSAMEGTIPDGRVEPFVLTWEGAGEVRLEGPFVLGEQNRSARRVEVFIDPSKGGGNPALSVSWSATDAADPLRAVHVWLPGMEQAGELFWPPFVEKVRALNAGRGPHTWRTLDWTRVNEHGRRNGFVFDVAGRITAASPSQGTPRGVATEYQVALCNLVGSNLHLSVPHRTDDLSPGDYVRYLVETLRTVRDGAPGVPGLFGGRDFEPLRPELTLTLELSNEIWNSIFPVNAWMNAQATANGIPFNQQVAEEIQLAFDVAEAVFTGSDAVRLKRYVGGFAGDPNYLRRVLGFLRAGTEIDGVGCAAYLGPRRADMDAWLAGSSAGSCPNCPDAAGLLDAARNAVDTLRPLIQQHRDIAQSWLNPDGTKPALVLYEGGLNLKSAGEPWAAAARELQTWPELFELFQGRYFPMLAQEEVALVNWYSFMSDQDAATVDAYGVWNDIRQEIKLPVAREYLDEGAPKAAVVCLGPPLAATCPRASATLRTAPGNVLSYTATPPVLGGVFRAEVDVTLSSNDSAFVVASLQPTTIPLSTGQSLLAGVTQARFLPIENGPIARWEECIPNDPTLAGITIATQAFQFGGAAPLNLSNAFDLTFGR